VPAAGPRLDGRRPRHQLPLAPPPDELPPPELPDEDEDEDEKEDEEEKNELSLLSLSVGTTQVVVSLRPQCSQCSVNVSRPLCVVVGDLTRLSVRLSVTKPQAGHFK
jgi:hypothetical protein